MVKTKIIQVESESVSLLTHQNTDFISLTDMVRASESGSAIIENWLRNKITMRPTPQQSQSHRTSGNLAANALLQTIQRHRSAAAS
ncbi:MAG: hypothetical protein GZ093_11600 [Rhodoferax sp.]|uniref:KilA-N domain-containing protein n=1 Tax=Rhodoferax sp. TaxID=50421 RepID=UPI0014009085|nr:KilA-N domain-containing protein [Rhodoferax sp.]NDP39378.1 hypothetical protein [Rhodoferax sp.]